MKQFVFAALAAAVAFSGSQSFAQNQISIARQCNVALSRGDMSSARPLAEQILAWDSVLSNITALAKHCLEGVFEKEFVYLSTLGGFVSPDEAAAFRSDQSVGRAQEALQATFSAINKLYALRNELLLEASVKEACLNLAKSEPARAFTNETCVGSFKRNGHPDLESLDSFAAALGRDALNEIDDRHRRVLEGLNQEEIAKLCDGELAPLCTLAGVDE